MELVSSFVGTQILCFMSIILYGCLYQTVIYVNKFCKWTSGYYILYCVILCMGPCDLTTSPLSPVVISTFYYCSLLLNSMYHPYNDKLYPQATLHKGIWESVFLTLALDRCDW
jgi:hypothetical protein